jgi:predicted aspartyl protease
MGIAGVNMQRRRTDFSGLVAGLAALVAASAINAPVLAAPKQCKLGVMADLPVTMQDTRSSVPAKVNGKETRFWLDSGAFFSIMPQAKATELGLLTEPLPIGFYVEGIGGAASVKLTRIKSFGIVGQELKNMQFMVGGSDAGNGLIGRNILGLRDTEFDLADGSVKLINSRDCEHADMAYWAMGKPYFTVPLLPPDNGIDNDFKLPVTINGVRLEAVFDTGAETSGLSRSAARRAGINLAGPDVLSMETGGVGRHYVKGWVVPVANISIGDEQILRSHLDVFDDNANSGLPDLLLGADYMMAHHIYVSRVQHMIYFTYTGGKPFRTSREIPVAVQPGAKAPPVTPPSGLHVVEAVVNSAGDPKTAEAFARRGAARLSAHNAPGAIADLSEAIRQSPATADFYANRARAYAMADNAEAETADVDKALTLNPEIGELLRARAGRRLANNDRTGALTDAEAAARVTPPASLDSGELAELFVRLHQPARAVTMYTAVIAVHRDDSGLEDMLSGRCWARALANIDLDKALVDCNRAIKRYPARGDWLDSRGLVYFRLANYPLAIGDYDAALKIYPKVAWTLYMRGQARIFSGHETEGKADQAAALAMRPGIAEEVAAYGIGVKAS